MFGRAVSFTIEEARKCSLSPLPGSRAACEIVIERQGRDPSSCFFSLCRVLIIANQADGHPTFSVSSCLCVYS